MNKLTHLDKDGRATMVDVSEKPETPREAVASGVLEMSLSTFEVATSRGSSKGDPIAVAEL